MSGQDDRDDERSGDAGFRIPIRPKDAQRLRELGEGAGRMLRTAGAFLEAVGDFKKVAGTRAPRDARTVEPVANPEDLGAWHDCPCGKGGAYSRGRFLTCECGRALDPASGTWR